MSKSSVSAGESLGSIGSPSLIEASEQGTMEVVETTNKGLYVDPLVKVGRELAFAVGLVESELGSSMLVFLGVDRGH